MGKFSGSTADISPHSVATLTGFLRSGLRPGGSGLRPGVHSRWSHTCARFWMTHTAQKFPHLPFSKEVSHETWSWRPFFRRCRFTSTPCSFFEYRQAWHFRDILRSKTSFCVDRCRTLCTFSSVWQAWPFADVAKTLAGVSHNQRCFWMQFFAAGAVFGEVG